MSLTILETIKECIRNSTVVIKTETGLVNVIDATKFDDQISGAIMEEYNSEDLETTYDDEYMWW